jgi:cell division transport system ATP-binding protein
MAAAAIISFNQVSKSYPGGDEALCGINFSIDAGEMVFITGHSGAGKSTLLKLIAAVERASSGTVLVGGQNVGALGSRGIPFLRRKLGLVFQDQKLLYDRSVFDNVMLPLLATGQASRDAGRRARAALDKVGLLEREPAILIADEPTSNLDGDSARQVLDLFRSFHQVGVTVLVATHDPAAAGDMAPRLLSLARGRLS